MSSQHFIQEFHNLAGNTVAEKKRSLFQLLNKNSSLPRQDLDAIASALTHESYLERIFLVEFLIYFRRFDELFEKFKNGDEIVISKVSRHSWFFEHINLDSLVDELLPSVSFSVRCKILNRLHLSEEAGDKVFEGLRQRYGVHFASKILEKCSSKKVAEVLGNFPVQLSAMQLRVLFDKQPGLIPLYFDERFKHDKDFDVEMNPILLYIAKQNPGVFCELKAKYKIDVALGKRATKKFVLAKKTEVLAKPDVYHSNLNSASVVRCLGKDFANYYSALFKAREDEDVLKHYPRNGRFNLYKNTYSKILNKKLSYSGNVMEMMPTGERERLAKDLFKESGDENYYQYYNPSECFEIIRSKMNNEKDESKRGEYIGFVTKSCCLNRDLDVLLKVSKFVKRFKSDTYHIRDAFCSGITDARHIINCFDKDLWKILDEILALRKSRGEWYWTNDIIASEYMLFLFNNKQPMKYAIKKYVNDNSRIYSYDEYVNNPKFHKQLLIECIEAFPEVLDDQDLVRGFHAACVRAVARYNRKNKQDPIEIYNHPRLIQSLKDHVANESEICRRRTSSAALNYVICRKDADAELVKLFFEKFELVGTPKSVAWFLKHNPKVIEDRFEDIFKHMDSVHGLNAQKIWYLLKKYQQFNDRAIALCLSKFQDETYSVKQDLTKPLAILMKPCDYIELTNKYKPVSKTIDLNDKEAAELYKIQTKIALFLKKLKTPEAVLPLISEFCTGDYLAMSLSSLYSSTYNLPQNRVKYYLDELWNKPALSVKKHSLFLACEVLDQESVLNYMSKASLPTLLTIMLKYFVKNPNDKLWELLKSNLVKIEDTELLKMAITTQYPIKYRAEALQLLWDATLDKQSLKETFISGLTDVDVACMDFDLCKRILAYDLDASFIAKFLKLHKDPRKYKLLLEREHGSRYLLELCQACLENIWDDDKHDDESVSSLTANFSPNPDEAFKEYVMVELMQMRTGQNSLEDAVVELKRRLVESYGKLVQEPFLEVVNDSLGHILKDESARYKFYYNLLKSHLFVDDALFVIKLMSAAGLKYADSARYYEQTMKLLREFDNTAVQLQVDFHLRQ